MEKRKKLGGTSVSTLKTQETEISQHVGRKNDRAGYLTIDKGWNKFRLFPAHPGTESFTYASVKYFIPGFDDDGKRIKKTVFNSKVHGNTEKDLVEEYIKYLTEVTLSHLEGPAMEAVLKPIVYGGDFNLQPSIQWISYANKYDNKGKKVGFGRLGVTQGTKNKMEGLIPVEASDEAISIDPFSDEEDGIAIILTYNPDAKDKKGKKDAKNFYNVELEQKQIDKFRFEYIPTPLSEQEIEEFLKIETLQSMFKNSYRLRDFNIALEGIQIIDKECKFGVLKDPKFLEIVEEIKNYYPEEPEDEPEKEESSEIKDDLAKMDRVALKKLILSEFGQGIIVVYKNSTDDDIRNLIREKRKEMSSSELEQEPEIEESEQEPEQKGEKSDLPWEQGNNSTESDNLKKMREKMEARKAGKK